VLDADDCMRLNPKKKLVQFDLERNGISILRVLDQENNQECHYICPDLMTSCQVSEYAKMGADPSQTMTESAAIANALGRPQS
jgi:hypothetical protein